MAHTERISSTTFLLYIKKTFISFAMMELIYAKAQIFSYISIYHNPPNMRNSYTDIHQIYHIKYHIRVKCCRLNTVERII